MAIKKRDWGNHTCCCIHFPNRRANVQAEVVSSLSNFRDSTQIYFIWCNRSCNSILVVSIVRPRNSMVWLGLSTGFSLLTTKPRHSNRYTIPFVCSPWTLQGSGCCWCRLPGTCPSLEGRLRLVSASWWIPMGPMTPWKVDTWSGTFFREFEALRGSDVWGWQSMHLFQPIPLPQEILNGVNTLHFEVLGVDKLIEGFKIYHWSLPSILLRD